MDIVYWLIAGNLLMLGVWVGVVYWTEYKRKRR